MNTRPTPDFARGFKDSLPVAVSVLAYGSVLGVLAAKKQLTIAQLAIMNTAIFAGTAQFVMVEMWQQHLPLIEMTIAVLVMNLRYLLVGASLRPLFMGKSLLQKFLFMHFVADENWAMTMAAERQGKASIQHLLGGGICVYLFWSIGTIGGLTLGAAISNPEAFALDFAFIAVFLALVVGLWRDRESDLLPWIVAAAASILCAKLLPGKWYILAGGISGSAMAALFGKERPTQETNDDKEAAHA